MGCCQGKPNAQKLSDHEKCSNPENDSSFIPDYSQTEYKILAIEQEIEQNLSPSLVQKHLREVRRLQANVVVHKNKAKKECETQEKQKSEANFLIEIRKGKDIPSFRCIGGSKSFVQFQIQPWGVNYETMQGNAWIPKWFCFQRIKIKEHDQIKILDVQVQSSDKNSMQIGSLQLDLTQFKNKPCSNQWYPLENVNSQIKNKYPHFKPQIELRIQYIDNYLEFWNQRYEHFCQLEKKLNNCNKICTEASKKNSSNLAKQDSKQSQNTKDTN